MPNLAVPDRELCQTMSCAKLRATPGQIADGASLGAVPNSRPAQPTPPGPQSLQKPPAVAKPPLMSLLPSTAPSPAASPGNGPAMVENPWKKKAEILCTFPRRLEETHYLLSLPSCREWLEMPHHGDTDLALGTCPQQLWVAALSGGLGR